MKLSRIQLTGSTYLAAVIGLFEHLETKPNAHRPSFRLIRREGQELIFVDES
jgi:hypothetical protein